MPYLETGGARIAYTDTGTPTGRPDAPTVVFGHGLLFGGWMFRHQVRTLRGSHRCVTLDWRGQGASPAAGPSDMDTLALDAAAVVEALGSGPVHWVGLSMGGFVGLRLAARRAELLRSLTLLGTSADAEEPAAARQYGRLGAVQRLVGVRPIASRITPLLFGSDADPALVREWLVRLDTADRAGIRAAVRGVAERASVAGELSAIGVPTLIATGDQDRATPPDRARAIHAGIPGSRLAVLEGCGHTSALERPAEVTRLLHAFLHEVDRTSCVRGTVP
ncbi:alpha/beta fold hydrolase [Pseudonocardia ailaonensis]|uniref:Alpha/beta fold hydrolase n=1 Tax=Pseudonocardia ailaonensis TaxID=367279 RepID=A0ABN2N7T4_9PSEU